jgi:hypothetical protein
MELKYNQKSLLLFLLLTCLILVITSCIDMNKDKSQAGFSVTATLGGVYKIDTSEIVYIVGKLHNHSADTLSFLSMTCSWDDSWKISSPNLNIVKNLCFSNIPILVKLGPNESMLNYLPARLLKPYEDIKDEKFVVGFNLVKADTVEFSRSIKDLEGIKNFFWADSLQLNKLFRFNTIEKEK